MNGTCYSYFIVPASVVETRGEDILNCISGYENEIAKSSFKCFWYVKKRSIGRNLDSKNNKNLFRRILKEGDYSVFEIVDVAYESSMSISNHKIDIRRIGNSEYYNVVFETRVESEHKYESIYAFSRRLFVILSGIYGFLNVEEDKVQINHVYVSPLSEHYFLDQIMGIYWKNFLSHGHWAKLNQGRNIDETLFHELTRLDDSRFVVSMGKYPRDFLELLSSGRFMAVRKELSAVEPVGV